MDVKGDTKHELYKWLAESPKHPGAEPEWNFAKFLLKGTEPHMNFDPKTPPADIGKYVAELAA